VLSPTRRRTKTPASRLEHDARWVDETAEQLDSPTLFRAALDSEREGDYPFVDTGRIRVYDPI
jgi:hypothetical protein